MDANGNCKVHGGVEASFSCDSCGTPFCAQCLGKESEGKKYCLGCSIQLSSKKATDQTKSEAAKREERVALAEEARAKSAGTMKWLVPLLCFAIPIICFEIFLLQRNKPQLDTEKVAAEVEVLTAFDLLTALEQYEDATGSFPPELDYLVPEYWDSEEQTVLQRYQYQRAQSDDFSLRWIPPSRESGDFPNAAAKILPAELSPDTDFGEIFRKLDEL